MLKLEDKIKEMKSRRIKLGLTRTKIGKLAGLSQSFISKLETNKINPSYEYIRKMDDTLRMLEKKKETKAEEIMVKPIGIQSKDKIKKAIKLMKKNDFSQLPVFDEGFPVGSISERDIIVHQEKFGSKKLNEMPAEKIMSSPFPTISKDTGIGLIRSLLKYNDAVLVMKGKEAEGIITKSDIIGI